MILVFNNRSALLLLAQFIARKFDLYGTSKSINEDPVVFQGLIDGVVSCAYTDIILNVFMLLYSEVNFDQPNWPCSIFLKKIPVDLKLLNNLLATSSTSFFYDQAEPTIADYFVFEAFTLTKDFHSALLPEDEDSQALYKLEKAMRDRPGLNKYFNEGHLFSRLSGSPTEDRYRATFTTKKSELKPI